MLVFSNAVEGRDDEYNKWYDTIHLNDVLSLPAFTSGARFDVANASLDKSHRYVAIYDCEGSAEDAFNALMAAVPSMNISDALDMAGVKFVLVEDHESL
jgi:hypothetical protein